VLNVICIVRIAMLSGRECLIREGKPYVAQVHRLETEVATLREELRINGARTRRIDPLSFPKTPSGNCTSRPATRRIE
jgi:hypothetical protein